MAAQEWAAAKVLVTVPVSNINLLLSSSIPPSVQTGGGFLQDFFDSG